MRNNKVICSAQPASFTACDSLTFMFDLAASVMWSRYQDVSGMRNKANGNLEYLALQFPLWKRYIAFSAGVLPYSAVGYDITLADSIGSGYHYMVADANGDCAVIEFDKEDGWKTMVVRKGEGENSMLVTNHLLSPKYYTEIPDQSVGNTHSRSWWRYETAGSYLAGHDGILTPEQAQECLALVHWKDLVWDNGMVEDTQFSNVYDQSALTLWLRSWNDYDNSVRFNLE